MVERIQALCKQRGINIRMLEEALNIGNGVIARWKTSEPKAKNLAAVADYFGVSMEYILYGEQANTDSLRFALFGGSGDVTDEMVDEVLSFAEFVKQREAGKRR